MNKVMLITLGILFSLSVVSALFHSDGFDVDVAYQPDLVCDPSSIKCIDANILRTCSEDGTNYTDEKCKNGCVVSQDGLAIGECVNGGIEEGSSRNLLYYSIPGILILLFLLIWVLKKKK